MVTILKHRNELKQKERWRLTATEPGTRKLGKAVRIIQFRNKYIFLGKPVIDLGKIIHKDGGENMIVTDGLEFLIDMLIDLSAVYDSGILDCAEGTNSTAPAAGQAALVTEAARKVITSRSRSGVEGTFSTFFTAAEANDAIEEAGLFGGTGALGVGNPDTGVMFARWLVSYDNSTPTADITFDYVLTPSYS